MVLITYEKTEVTCSLEGKDELRLHVRWQQTQSLFCGEPFAGVDPVAVEDVQRIMAHLKNKNIGILIANHNVQETLAITDKTYLMFEGNILKQGLKSLQDEMVRKVYLGQNFELRKKLNFKNKLNRTQGYKARLS